VEHRGQQPSPSQGKQIPQHKYELDSNPQPGGFKCSNNHSTLTIITLGQTSV